MLPFLHIIPGMPTHEYGMPDLDKPKIFGAINYINPRIKAFSVEIESNKTSYKPGEGFCNFNCNKNGIPLPNAELTLWQ